MLQLIKPSKVLKLPNFRNLYFAGATSELGSFVTETVLMLFVFKLSGQDKSYLGILRATFLVCLTLGGILGGPIGNSFNRKKVLIICDIARIPLLITLFFVQTIPIVIACDAIIAFFTGIFRPSRQALLNEIVPKEQIKKANGLFGSTNAILHLIGPLIGATLFGLLNGIDFILTIDLLTYLLGIFLLSRINYTPITTRTSDEGNILSETVLGFKYILQRKDLFAININGFCAGAAIGILIPLLVPFTIEVLGKTETDYGLLMTFFGLGGIIGSSSAEFFSRYLPNGKIPILSILLESLIFLFFIYNRWFPLSCAILFIWGFLVFIRITTQMNFISDSVETSMLTRVYSLLEMSFIVPNISGGILIALIGNQQDTMELLSKAAVLFIALVFLRLPFKHMRILWNIEPAKVNRDIQI